jgi:hypothetical protein
VIRKKEGSEGGQTILTDRTRLVPTPSPFPHSPLVDTLPMGEGRAYCGVATAGPANSRHERNQRAVVQRDGQPGQVTDASMTHGNIDHGK